MMSDEELADLHNNLFEKLIEKCKYYNIDVTKGAFDFDDSKYVQISINDGRSKRDVILYHKNAVEMALKCDFQDFHFLNGYQAIVNYKQKTIEALFGNIGSARPGFVDRTSCAVLFGSEKIDVESFNSAISTKDPESKIELGTATEIARLLCLSGSERWQAASLKITSNAISGHDQALRQLQNVANAIFFQIESKSRILLQLNRVRRHRRFRNRILSTMQRIDLQFPEMEYDPGPISLFWYGRSAEHMPLLQFLAFYQVIEYYYPTFSQIEAKNMIKNILKDPGFRSERDTDIGRILSIMSVSGRGFGSERSQLRATLNACLNPQELRAFLEEEEDRREFFSMKQRGLTERKILAGDKAADLRDPVADLIYDIRCKIVHTKADGDKEIEMLLPFSDEAERLYHDIELIEWIAKKVLIAASVQMSV